jgi:hypothetical protein
MVLIKYTKKKNQQEEPETFKAVCLRRISLDLNITAAIQIVTKKPA